MRVLRQVTTVNLISLAVVLFALDACIVFFRALGLPRDLAVYAGVAAFATAATLLMRRVIRRHGTLPVDSHQDPVTFTPKGVSNDE